MKRFAICFAVACIGMFCMSDRSEVYAEETVSIVESYTCTESTSCACVASNTVQHRAFRPVRNTLRAGRNVVRGTVRVATSPIRALRICR